MGRAVYVGRVGLDGDCRGFGLGAASGLGGVMEDRNWRNAKMPQWVKDAVQAEIDQTALTAALSWPTEAKPAPAPFQWVEYDRLHGEAVPGRYWVDNGRWVDIRRKTDSDKGPRIEPWKNWVFRNEGYEWKTAVQRGPLYLTQHDAKLAKLWGECEAAAKGLMATRKWMLS